MFFNNAPAPAAQQANEKGEENEEEILFMTLKISLGTFLQSHHHQRCWAATFPLYISKHRHACRKHTHTYTYTQARGEVCLMKMRELII